MIPAIQPAHASDYVLVTSSTTKDPTTAINTTGYVAGTGTATKTASANDYNVYGSGTTGAAANGAGGLATYGPSITVHQTWVWDTADPDADPAPPAESDIGYSYDGSVYATTTGANSSAGASAAFTFQLGQVDSGSAIVNDPEYAFGPAGDDEFYEEAGDTEPFNITSGEADLWYSAYSTVNGPASSSSATSGQNHIGVDIDVYATE